MALTYFFYDLETSGLNPRHDRIMQFAGIRTDMSFQPIGEPYNVLVKLSDDTLPNPDALMVTGITPQQTQADGYTEAEFAQLLIDEVFLPDTLTLGFNNIRFDDEFIRHLFWRTFRDSYEWCWKENCSRWDMLDVVRMTRALRPEGIEWPVDRDGKATNRLELITKLNGIDHFKAHDALSDVEALIAVSKLIHDKQPQLYEYLLQMRSKKDVQRLVNLEDKRPFVYVNGRYDTAFNKASVAFPLTQGKNGNVVVYDLRIDPTPFLDLSADELRRRLYATKEERQDESFACPAIQELQYNQAPAVAPLGVLEQADGWKKIGLSLDVVEKHARLLLQAPHFAETVRTVFETKPSYKKDPHPEGQLYDSFVNEKDKQLMEVVRNASARELTGLHPPFTDERLAPLLLHYKARNYPNTLSQDESRAWERWRAQVIHAQLPGFSQALNRLSRTVEDDAKRFVLEELQLWAESIMPADLEDEELADD